jgi:catechol 2,3-dioxygenase-like lactoylglutathione lyase family enzyme
MIRRIHHLNIVVRDLATAASRYGLLLGQPVPEPEVLAERGVRLVRFRLGELWLILVQPERDDSVPGQFLAEHGEGVFLVSGEVDDVREESARLAERGIFSRDPAPRRGLDDWQLIDLDVEGLNGVHFQLVQSAG